MRAAIIFPVVIVAVGSVFAVEPIQHLPPIDATQVSDSLGGRWRPRRLPPTGIATPESPSEWPGGPSVAADAFATATRTVPDPPEDPLVSPVTYPRILTQPLLEDVPQEQAPFPRHVSSHKNGFFQRLAFTGTWLARPNGGDVGIGQLDLFGMFALPMPTTEMPLVITPGFSVYFIDGPASPGPDLPPRIYDAYLELRWIPKFGERLLADLAVSPGVHSDFEQWSDSALRITGRGIGVYTWSPRLKILLGIIYLDRSDVSMLPACGIIWTPTDDWSLELLSPRPRIARRLFYDGTREDWFYIAGELGGGSWSVERVSGLVDVLTTRDYRVLLGVERKRPGGAGTAGFEAGWVFGRELEYAKDPAVIKADSTVMLRGGIAY